MIVSMKWFLASIRSFFRKLFHPQPWVEQAALMGRLEPQRVSVMAVSKSQKIPVKVVKPPPDAPPCDACHVQPARFKILLDTGELSLCGHHFRKHRFALVRYEVEELLCPGGNC